VAGAGKLQFQGLQIKDSKKQGHKHAVVVALLQRVVEQSHTLRRRLKGIRILLYMAHHPGHKQRSGNTLVRYIAH